MTARPDSRRTLGWSGLENRIDPSHAPEGPRHVPYHASRGPPLRREPSGAIRVGQTRVLLELVVHAFRDGATPEEIVQGYSTLGLAEVYAVIAYALRHPEEIESYLAEREQVADEVRRRIEATQGDLGDIRRRLLARKKA